MHVQFPVAMCSTLTGQQLGLMGSRCCGSLALCTSRDRASQTGRLVLAANRESFQSSRTIWSVPARISQDCASRHLAYVAEFRGLLKSPMLSHTARSAVQLRLRDEAVELAAMAQNSQQLVVRTISRHEDPELADRAAKTLSLAMPTREEASAFWVLDPKDWTNDWWATAINYQLRMPTVRFIHTLQDGACMAYAYWYPEQKPDWEAPEPQGAVSTSSWERPEGVPVLADVLGYLADCGKVFLEERGPFLYLAYMSVHPDHQGNGLGATMLKHLTSIADEAGKWMYLESSNPDNMRLYLKFGFEACGRERTFTMPDTLPGVALTLITMGRPPTPKKGGTDKSQ